MKLFDTILFSLAVALFIIGVHQSFTVGLTESYWIFMLVIALLMAFKMRKNKQAAEDKETVAAPEKSGKTAKPVKPKSGAR